MLRQFHHVAPRKIPQRPFMPEVELGGCTPAPLMSYLKALGILRLVGEQKDPVARGWWREDVFWLRSKLDSGALIEFLLEEYRPTPIVAPWAGGSGFFGRDNKEAVEALSKSESPRTKEYAQTIRLVWRVIKEEGILGKPKDEEKSRLIRIFRNRLPDSVVPWIDAAMVLAQDGQTFAPLLGTGGNDGRLDFTQNFMQRIVKLGLHAGPPVGDESRSWLANALYAKSTRLTTASVGQFSPGRVGGANATQGMERGSIDNPWDFVLMLEGAIMLAGAAVRRLGATENSRASFPFTVRAVAAGFDSSGSSDEAGSRGELWLPTWRRPSTALEIARLFGESRVEVSGRPARDGTDFARAVAGLGIDRGLTDFTRFAFLKRSGKAFLATPIGRFSVTDGRETTLLGDIDNWLRKFRRACGAKNSPVSFVRLLHQVDSGIMDLCRSEGSSSLAGILFALGKVERGLATAERFRAAQKIPPIKGLSSGWRAATNDGSAEFQLALALASIRDTEERIGSLRVNLEPIDEKKRFPAWAESGRCAVWNATDLPTNLLNVLQRRVLDGERANCTNLPLSSSYVASLNTVAAFIAGGLDDQRIEEALWGLVLVDPSGPVGEGVARPVGPRDPPVLPRDYALLKLLFLPRPITAERRGDAVRWRYARGREAGATILPEPAALSLLRAGRVGEACSIAAGRLRFSGLPPMPGRLSGGTVRNAEWSEQVTNCRRGQRLAAALLIPISDGALDHIVHLVCGDLSPESSSLSTLFEGGTAA